MMSLCPWVNKSESIVNVVVKSTVDITMEHVARFVIRLFDVAKSELERVYANLSMIATSELWSGLIAMSILLSVSVKHDSEPLF